MPALVRARMDYSFRVFAAIYGYEVLESTDPRAAIRFEYGSEGCADQPNRFHIPARYRPRSANTPVDPLTKHRFANEDVYLFYGIDPLTGKPDWIGEIFEWISSSHEFGISERDSIKRIPFSKMIFSTQGISPCKPYASILMAWLENTRRHGNCLKKLSKAPPAAGQEHIVVCSHDIDFYYLNRRSALVRVLKNLGISNRSFKSWSFFAANCSLLFELFRGKRVGDYLPGLTKALETKGFRSTLFVIPRRGHRRDANYLLKDLGPHLPQALRRTFSVELHGSYTSVIENHTLLAESQALAEAMGSRPMGNRQHWLRFSRHEALFQAIEAADLVFDSTLGFSDAVGFRNGASFAFPPYDFTNEKPYEFLEIPLAIMDTSLAAASKALGKPAQVIADEVLQESRKWGWGGVSVLWHNPMEALNVPPEINRVFWECAGKRQESGETWMCGRQFLTSCLDRYKMAGLLKSIPREPASGPDSLTARGVESSAMDSLLNAAK